MTDRSCSRVHDICRRDANKCRYCNHAVALPKKVHEECRINASNQAKLSVLQYGKRCGKCRKLKMASEFSDDITRFDGKYTYCMICQMNNNLSGRLQNSSDELTGHDCPVCDTPLRGKVNRKYCSSKCKWRVKALKDKFNMSINQYRQLVNDTKGRCPICNRFCNEWHVDHNHKTGKVMGVVCITCNIGLLAYSKHSIERAKSLLRYLTDSPASQLGITVTVHDTLLTPTPNLQSIWKMRGTTSDRIRGEGTSPQVSAMAASRSSKHV